MRIKNREKNNWSDQPNLLDADQYGKALIRLLKTHFTDDANAKNEVRLMKALLYQVGVALFVISPALALSPAEQRGKTFALTNCARCHSIDRVTESPLKIAPPFRTLHLRYPVETLGEALAEGIETGHPTMPAFQLDPDQIHDLLSYLKTLE
jgi:cytochrome c